MSESDSGGAVVSLAQRRAQAKAREAEAARQQARQQARAPDGERSKPWVTYAVIAVNVVMWIAMVGAGVDAYEPNALVMTDWGANYGIAVSGGQWWRMLTATFLHYGIIHLACNMYFAWVIGRMCEPIFGSVAYGVVYFGSGMIASLVATAWDPMATGAGASAALLGAFGAFLAFVVRRRSVLPPEYVRWVRLNALILLGINAAFALMIPDIGIAAHLAGLIAGFGLGYLLTTMGEKPVTTPSEAKAVRVRATVAAAIISVVVLVGGALALPRYEDPRPVVTEIADRHNELIERYDALESPAERIAVIEGELVPAFREAELALRDIGTVPADVRTSIDNRIIYFERQQKAYALEVEGLRNNDPVVLAEAEDLHAEAIAELE